MTPRCIVLFGQGSKEGRKAACECVAICSAIIEDDKIEDENHPAEELYEGCRSHPLLAHPLASHLMEAVERWVREQSLGNDPLLALAEVRRIAGSMLRDSEHGEGPPIAG